MQRIDLEYPSKYLDRPMSGAGVLVHVAMERLAGGEAGR